MQEKIKARMLSILSYGTYPGMDESLKLAIQVSTFIGYWTLVTLIFYVWYTGLKGFYGLTLLHGAGATLVYYGLFAISKRNYHAARMIFHVAGLVVIFLTNDATGYNAGAEYFYIANVAIPFVMYPLQERWRGFLLSGLSIAILIFQEMVGTGLILSPVPANSYDRMVSICVVIIFIVSVMAVSRWQMALVQNEIRRQQAELVHNSNLIALGEMSGGIAHEINNPLQILSLHNESIRRHLSRLDQLPPKVMEQMDTVDRTISRISSMIKGLKQLSRDVTHDPLETFSMKEALTEVLTVSAERLKSLQIKLTVKDQSTHKVQGHVVQVSQVLINLLNNSIDALEGVQDKWIQIDIEDRDKFVTLSFTDSGKGISQELVHKIMQPFFTTKEPGKGTGLGLSISKSIIEKCGGRFAYDSHSPHTRFVLELPSA